MSVAFSPDDTTLVSGADNELIMWSVDAWKVIWRATFEPAGPSIRSMAFSPDGSRFASGLSDGQLHLWNTTITKEMIPLPWRGRSQDPIISIAFLTDGKKALTAMASGDIRLFDVETGDILGKFDIPGKITSVAVSPDCSHLASYQETRVVLPHYIRIWDVENALASVQGMDKEDTIRSEFDNEDRSGSAFYSPRSVQLALSRIAEYDYSTGFMKVDDRNIFWTSPDFYESVCDPYNPLVFGPYGTTLMDYSSMNLCIGKKWVNCWLAQ
ncbi:hypothetical protein D9613_011792 [Agrocybe pediades]|uniref:Anaphase-promoting complex subunit 4 WD40 domain-containing protein n=1 Tax=Agrocybe pediades TaxID=84607 RepID=A0A8H4QKS6_9AGAR|nr:hypothetical protein D9613_011792 [Agrocybe pediades]